MIQQISPGPGRIVASTGTADEWVQVIAYEPHPEIWALVIGVGAAYLRLSRWTAQDNADPITARSRRTFLLGLLVMWLALDWPIDDVSDGSLLAVHMVQYLLLSVIAPALMLRGCPRLLLERLLAGRRRMTLAALLRNPWVAWAFVSAVLLTSHVPPVVEVYLTNDLAHLAMHAVWLASGVALWWPILSPVPAEMARPAPPMQIAYLFLQSLMAIIPASFLTFSSTPIYDAYARLPKPAAIDAVMDQQMAGVLMKVGGGLLLWVAIAVIFFRWASQEEAAMTPRATGVPITRRGESSGS